MIDLPCNIESVESVKVDIKNQLIELIVLVNNEVVENTRIKLNCLITNWHVHSNNQDD